MIAIIDYGVGNLFSLKSSFAAIGEDAVVTGDVKGMQAADRLILPGVGAFGDASEKLFKSGLAGEIELETANGKPLLGICLGMQLLFEKSLEYGEHTGLGLLQGKVVPMRGIVPSTLKIPQIGWNALKFVKPSPLFKNIDDGAYVYFVHSYFASECGDSLIAFTEYGADISAAVQKDNVFGCQFHPEKSGDVGLKILKAFCEV
ncbi:MAG: imidazole glycerol phosphate synthase subunit HisH [Clostridia bacterium]|nr:imidazole glycerol phosphate synthase subunit HisH [Clostridia bacterium]